MDLLNTIISASIGMVFGFAIPYAMKAWERATQKERIAKALDLELSESINDIKKKMEWLSRDVSEHLTMVDQDLVATTKEGKKQYLGENEEFIVSRSYWLNNYSEIVEVLDNTNFSRFYRSHRSIDAFETKFKEMKNVFSNKGDKNKMALICFNDLRNLELQLISRAKQ